VIVAEAPNYRDASAKLDEARKRARLAELYAAGASAYQAGAWLDAIGHLDAIIALDPEYRDAAALHADAGRQLKLAELYAEARELHRAQAWPAVLNVIDRIHALNPAHNDSEHLESTAREALAAEERQRAGEALLGRGLAALDSANWREAIAAFQELQDEQPGYPGVDGLLAQARARLAQQEPRSGDEPAEERLKPVANALRPVGLAADASPAAATPVRRTYLLVGTGIGLLAAIVLIVVVTSSGRPPSGSPTPAPPLAAQPVATPTVVPTLAPTPVAAAPVVAPPTAVAPTATAVAVPASPLTGTVKIVSSLPRTGASGSETDTLVNAIKMAIANHNKRVGGAEIEYVDMDDAARGSWDAAQEAINANKAAADPDVMVYLGPYNSGAAKVSIPILCAANVAMISPSNSYPGLTRNTPHMQPNEPDVYYPGCSRNFARVAPTYDLEGAAAATWAKQLGVNRVYVLTNPDDYGLLVAEGFNTTAKQLGLTVVGDVESIDPRASEYRGVAQRIQASGAELVFFGGYTDTSVGKLWQALRGALGAGVKLMGPDGIQDSAFIDMAGAAAEGTHSVFTGVFAPKLTSRAGRDWYGRYKQQFQGEPGAYAAYAYEAANVAIAAIEKAGMKDRAKIRDAVLATREYDGVLGKWSLSDSGDISITTMSGVLVKNGRWDYDNAVLVQLP
jgi:branched-chain amino acid transport system substrate-binding protein